VAPKWLLALAALFRVHTRYHIFLPPLYLNRANIGDFVQEARIEKYIFDGDSCEEQNHVRPLRITTFFSVALLRAFPTTNLFIPITSSRQLSRSCPSVAFLTSRKEPSSRSTPPLINVLPTFQVRRAHHRPQSGLESLPARVKPGPEHRFIITNRMPTSTLPEPMILSSSPRVRRSERTG
jgi:hypothetical protein